MYVAIRLMILKTTFLLRLESTTPDVCNLIGLRICINPLLSLSTGSDKLVDWKSFSALTTFLYYEDANSARQRF